MVVIGLVLGVDPVVGQGNGLEDVPGGGLVVVREEDPVAVSEENLAVVPGEGLVVVLEEDPAVVPERGLVVILEEDFAVVPEGGLVVILEENLAVVPGEIPEAAPRADHAIVLITPKIDPLEDHIESLLVKKLH